MTVHSAKVPVTAFTALRVADMQEFPQNYNNTVLLVWCPLDTMVTTPHNFRHKIIKHLNIIHTKFVGNNLFSQIFTSQNCNTKSTFNKCCFIVLLGLIIDPINRFLDDILTSTGYIYRALSNTKHNVISLH